MVVSDVDSAENIDIKTGCGPCRNAFDFEGVIDTVVVLINLRRRAR